MSFAIKVVFIGVVFPLRPGVAVILLQVSEVECIDRFEAWGWRMLIHSTHFVLCWMLCRRVFIVGFLRQERAIWRAFSRTSKLCVFPPTKWQGCVQTLQRCSVAANDFPTSVCTFLRVYCFSSTTGLRTAASVHPARGEGAGPRCSGHSGARATFPTYGSGGYMDASIELQFGVYVSSSPIETVTVVSGSLYLFVVAIVKPSLNACAIPYSLRR